MSRTPPYARWAAVIIGAHALVACLDLPEITYETERLRIGTEFAEPLCQGDLDYLEALLTSLETQLDTTVEEPIEVYLWGQRDTMPLTWCDDDLSGCYRGGTVYTSEVSLDHELVHAVVGTFANPPAFWSEGAAEALASSRTLFTSSTPTNSLESEDPVYAVAGHFSRWALETFGEESYRALLRHPGSAREAFEATYGLSVEDAEAAYFEQAPHSYGALIACGHPELPSVGELAWSEELDIDCGQPHVYGGTAGIKAKRVLTISQRGYYAFSTTAESALIMRCHDETYEEAPSVEESELYGDVPAYTLMWISRYPVVVPGEEESTVLDLTPGRYEVLVGYTSTYEPRAARLDVTAASEPSP